MKNKAREVIFSFNPSLSEPKAGSIIFEKKEANPSYGMLTSYNEDEKEWDVCYGGSDIGIIINFENLIILNNIHLEHVINTINNSKKNIQLNDFGDKMNFSFETKDKIEDCNYYYDKDFYSQDNSFYNFFNIIF